MKAKRKTKEEVYTTTVSSRGQVVLPAPLRRQLKLRKGMRIRITVDGQKQGQLVLQTMEGDAISRLCGSMPGAAEAMDFLEQEKKRDRERGR
jgi:AbrB family looped-hinge helix DNA binding protein